jgi:tetratricopeptide (TPR) repeat protein
MILFRKDPLIYLMLSIAVLFVASTTLSFEFVWDDHIYLLMKPAYFSGDLRQILLNLPNGLEYLPVRDLSYFLDAQLWGKNPRGFHLTNLVLYYLNVIAVYLLARQLCAHVDRSPDETHHRVTAFWVALLFAIHPLHSEVMSFITCRNALLSGLFFFLTSYFYLIYLQSSELSWRMYLASVICALLALLSKATALPLPLVLILFSAYSTNRDRKAAWKESAPFLLMSILAFFFFRTIAMNSFLLAREEPGTMLAKLPERLVVAMQIPFFYLGKLAIPSGYAAEYDKVFARDYFSVNTVTSIFLLLLIALALYTFRQRYPMGVICTGWFFLTLLPVLNLLPTHPVIADRYAYIPSFGIILLVAYAANSIKRPSWRLTAAISGILLVTVLAILAIKQNSVWKNNESLWRHNIKTAPLAVKPYTNLGRVYFQNGRFQEAFPLFDRARRLSPSDPHYDFFEGYLFLVKGEFNRAILSFEQALQRNSDFVEALYHLGVACEESGQKQKAIAAYSSALAARYDDWGDFKGKAREGLRRLGAPP